MAEPAPPQQTDPPVVDLAAVVAAFGQRLHAAGVPITPERSARFAQAITLVAPTRLRELYWTGRTTLLSGHEQQDLYDAVFGEVFRGVGGLPLPPAVAANPSPSARESGQDQPGRSQAGGSTDTGGDVLPAGQLADAEPSEPADGEAALAAASATERLRERDFSTCTPEELAVLAKLAEQFALAPPRRRSRRRRRDRGGRYPDVRATLRAAHRTGGDPVRLVRRRRDDRPRRLVLIADVSGSMEPYSRVYLHLMRGAVRGVHAESFVFATRLTRLTRLLAQNRPDAAYRAVARAATDWSSGTRIGPALMEFLDEHGRRGVARGAVVVIVSDGWEVGDPAVVGEAMRRLARLAHHVIWVNPRSARPGFEPLVGGLRAALPHVGTLVSGHSLRAVEEVLAAIAAAGHRRWVPRRAVGPPPGRESG
jgi:uncharacterized protein with von Willebrand factor type A (vWA) domain